MRVFDLDKFLMKEFIVLLKKEVIQPLVPQRLPCYDFIPVTDHTFGAFFLQAG